MRMAAPGAAVLALAAASVCLSVAAAVATGPTVTIYRDSYGVPHVYGDSEAAAAFGVGYAQAEDRLDALLLNYLKAEG
ncbi:penicillin acylase family protein, partial [bacterium]|nr:penicillin acylase family protein [bacterium]